jgi:beta-fructofuranosidase
MGLELSDRWIWDFWLVRDGRHHHVFYLQAPRSLEDPDLRHWNVSIGHAVSTDLRTWEVLPDALRPGPAGCWDDASTWTGSVVRFGDRWYMPYTGASSRDAGLVQRVGLAESVDLVSWVKHPEPVLEADPRWYELLDRTAWHDQAWRDPWAYVDPDDGQVHLLLTARVPQGDARGRGVIGHARSSDLRTWEALPPLTAPMGFGQMEVPQLTLVGDRAYLLFCSDIGTQSDALRPTVPGTGTYYLRGDGPRGPFPPESLAALSADPVGSTYAGKLHQATDGSLVFLSWLGTRPDGTFHGALSDPRPVEVADDGALVLR